MNRRHFIRMSALAGTALIVPPLAAQLAGRPDIPANPGSFFADFAGGSYGSGGFAEGFSFNRASAKTDLLPSSPPNASYRIFQPDAPAIVPGKGLLIEESREQFLANPDKPASQSTTLAAGGLYLLWVNGSGRATVAPGTAVLAGAGSAAHGDPLAFRVIAAGTVRIIVVGKLHAFQLEKGAAGTSLIPAKGRRAADNVVPAGSLATILGGGTGAVLVDAISTEATDPYASLVRIGANALGMDFYDGGISGTDDSSDHPKTAALGVGRFREGAKALLAWTPSGRRLVAGGGIVTRGPPLKVSNSTAMSIGVNGKDCWNGYIRRIEAFGQVSPDAQLRAMTADARPQIVMMGDSLTSRNEGGPDGLSVPARLGTLLGKIVLNGGVGGDSSSQIAKRYANSPELWSLPLVIWAGRNNYTDRDQVKTDIVDMVGRNSSGKVLVLSVINGQLPDEQSGGSNYGPRVGLNRALSKSYGANFLNVQAALLRRYDPLNPVDVLNRDEDRVPYSLRALNHGGGRFYLPSPLDASQPAFETSSVVKSDFVMRIGQEYMLVEAAKGSRIDAARRGYGKGGEASAHAAYTPYTRTDPVHLGDKGRAIVAAAIAEKIKALGW